MIYLNKIIEGNPKGSEIKIRKDTLSVNTKFANISF